MCIVWAVNKLRQFLLGIKFVIITDCQALVYLNNFKGQNAQVERWYDSLQEYEFEVRYRPGTQMAHVDALSRAPVGEERPSLDVLLTERTDVIGVVLSIEERVAMCQSADPEIARRKAELVNAPESEFVLRDGLLYRNVHNKLLFVMPKSMRKSLVVTAHDLSGHPGVDRTVGNIIQDFWFSGMRRYVKLHVHMCFECLLTKNPRGKRPGYLHPIPIGKRPFETVHVDHVGPFVTTTEGFKYILVMVDNFTNYVSLYAVEDTSAEQLIVQVKRFVDTFGLPGRLITDRGSCYTSGVFEEYCRQQGIRLVWTSSRHPQANGQVERIHSVVMATLRTAGVDSDGWSELLPEVQRLINNSESKSTTKTPFEMLYGYRPRFHLGALRELSTTANDWTPPAEAREEVRARMELSKQKVKAAYDLHRHDNIHYQVGEVVVMKRAASSTGLSRKLQDRYRGPLVITEILPGDVYRVVELCTGRPSRFATTAHVSQLKSWKLTDSDPVEEEAERKDMIEENAGEGEVKGTVSAPEATTEQEEAPVDGPVVRPRRKPKPPAWMKDYQGELLK